MKASVALGAALGVALCAGALAAMQAGAQPIMDVMTGQADVLFNGMLATLPPVKSGKLKLIAVSSGTRVASLPDTPTVAESLPGFVTGSWQGVLAPAGTPPETVSKLHAELARIIAAPKRDRSQGSTLTDARGG